MGRKLGVGATLAAALLAAPAALALHYSGYVGTTVYGYNTVADPAENHADTFLPVRFSVDHDVGLGNLAFIGNGRLFKDVGGDAGANGRVYYGYFRWRLPGDWLEANVGRQYIAAGPTAATVDGVRAVVSTSRKWRADLFGGVTVPPDFGRMRRFSSPAGEPSPDPRDRGVWTDHYVYGAHGGTNVKELWAGMPFPVWVGGGGSLTKSKGHLSNIVVGVDANQDLLSNLKVSEEVQYDYISRAVNYHYYSARYRPWDRLKTYVDYRWKTPRIDYTSIFSVFAREPHHRLRTGAQYKLYAWLLPFTDYSYGLSGENVNHRVRAGLDNNFDFAYFHYGALYGLGTRATPGGDEYGGFASAEFPKPIPAFEPLSAGASVEYLKYKPYGTETFPPDRENTLLSDVHGGLKFWQFLETTVGAEVLTNPDRKYEVRAYLQASAAISR